MNKQLRRLGIGLIACYVILFAQLNWLQVVKADDYNTDPRNDREVVRDFTRPAAPILTADGVVIAQQRAVRPITTSCSASTPPVDLFAGVGGYFSFVYGTDGVERQYNDVLAGQTPQQKLRGLGNLFNDDVNTGDVQLTLRNDIQSRGPRRPRRQGGLRRRVRSPHRRHPRHVEQPDVRPQPDRQPRLQRRQGGARHLPR